MRTSTRRTRGQQHPRLGHRGNGCTDLPPDELVADVTARLRDDCDICIVTNDAHIVLGLLGRSAPRSNQKTRVEDAMTPGPSTIRPSARLEAITKRMHDQNLTRIIVTRSDGVLFGVLRAEDIEPPSISR